jgi:hypothetical protein
MTDERAEDRLEKLASGFEDALISSDDSELAVDAADTQEVRAIIAGVLKAHGYHGNGARRPTPWPRSRATRTNASAQPRERVRQVPEPIRASFSSRTDADDLNDDNEPFGTEQD